MERRMGIRAVVRKTKKKYSTVRGRLLRIKDNDLDRRINSKPAAKSGRWVPVPLRP